MFRHYRLQLVVRAVLLMATAAGLVVLLLATELFYAPIAVGLLLIGQVVGLVRYAELAVRDVAHVLEAVRYEDFARALPPAQRGPLYDKLRDAFDEVMSAFREVRAQREENLRYLETVVQHVGVALMAYRADGSVEYLNPAAQELLDKPRLRHLRDLDGWRKPLVDALDDLGAGAYTVLKLSAPDRDLQLAVHATRFRLGGVGHTLVTLQDIRSELEAQEIEAWQKLTRVLTHEIMNSVAPISSLSATLKGKLNGGEADLSPETVADTREALDAIHRRSESLMQFVTSYRSFTRIPTPRFARLPVREVVEPVGRLLRVRAEKQGAMLSVSIEPPDLAFTADAELIEQVLINLLLNALEAVEATAQARVEVRVRQDENGRVLMQVADNGPGVPPPLRDQIFIPFFTTKPEGSGIGLSLSRQILRLHGGTLTLRSEPGETVFTLRF